MAFFKETRLLHFASVRSCLVLPFVVSLHSYYILIIIYYMSVRPSEIIVTRNHFNEFEEELAPSM